MTNIYKKCKSMIYLIIHCWMEKLFIIYDIFASISLTEEDVDYSEIPSESLF